MLTFGVDDWMLVEHIAECDAKPHGYGYPSVIVGFLGAILVSVQEFVATSLANAQAGAELYVPVTVEHKRVAVCESECKQITLISAVFPLYAIVGKQRGEADEMASHRAIEPVAQFGLETEMREFVLSGYRFAYGIECKSDV